MLSSDNFVSQNDFLFNISNTNFFPFYLGNLQKYLIQINYLNSDLSKIYMPSIYLQNLKLNSNEIKQINTSKEDNKITLNNFANISNFQGKKQFFIVNYSQNDSLFTKTDKNLFQDKEEINFLLNKRSPKRRQRKYNNDNIRRKIKRRFLNSALVKILNDKLINIGSKQYFEKFPQIIAGDIDQKRNKKILNMTLKEIFLEEELYKLENEKGLANYKHNLKVVQSEEIKDNEEFQKYLNKTFREL